MNKDMKLTNYGIIMKLPNYGNMCNVLDIRRAIPWIRSSLAIQDLSPILNIMF